MFSKFYFYQTRIILSRWAQAATERQMTANIVALTPAHQTKWRFPCLVGSHSKFSLYNSGTKGDRRKEWRKMKRNLHTLQILLSVNAEISFLLSVSVSAKWQSSKTSSVDTMGPAVLQKNERWCPARKVNGCKGHLWKMTEGARVICMPGWQGTEIIGLLKCNWPSEVLMLLLPLPDSRTGTHFLPEYFPTMPQILYNLDFIWKNNENIYFVFLNYISTLKVKKWEVFCAPKLVL